ncbi:hypothetical protein BGU76_00410, partial [Clostridioides difficile]|uniref:hypothetical protein n=1 Tax=Clostridioides difficile TaxID=1496 RepID=UPI000BD934CD
VECANNYEDGFSYTSKEFEEILRILYERRESSTAIRRGFIIEKLIQERIEISEIKVRKEE